VIYFKSARFKCFSLAKVSCLLNYLYLEYSSVGSTPFLFSLIPDKPSHNCIIPLSVRLEQALNSKLIKVLQNLDPK